MPRALSTTGTSPALNPMLPLVAVVILLLICFYWLIAMAFLGGPPPPGGPRPGGALRALPAPAAERPNPGEPPSWPGDAGDRGAGDPGAAGGGAAGDDGLSAEDIVDLLDAVERDEQ